MAGNDVRISVTDSAEETWDGNLEYARIVEALFFHASILGSLLTTMQYNTLRYDTIQCNAIQYNTHLKQQTVCFGTP